MLKVVFLACLCYQQFIPEKCNFFPINCGDTCPEKASEWGGNGESIDLSYTSSIDYNCFCSLTFMLRIFNI